MQSVHSSSPCQYIPIFTGSYSSESSNKEDEPLLSVSGDTFLTFKVLAYLIVKEIVTYRTSSLAVAFSVSSLLLEEFNNKTWLPIDLYPGLVPPGETMHFLCAPRQAIFNPSKQKLYPFGPHCAYVHRDLRLPPLSPLNSIFNITKIDETVVIDLSFATTYLIWQSHCQDFMDKTYSELLEELNRSVNSLSKEEADSKSTNMERFIIYSSIRFSKWIYNLSLRYLDTTEFDTTGIRDELLALFKGEKPLIWAPADHTKIDSATESKYIIGS